MGIQRGGDGRKPGSARYVMWAPFVSFFSWSHKHNFVVKHTVQYGTLQCSQSGVRLSQPAVTVTFQLCLTTIDYRWSSVQLSESVIATEKVVDSMF